MPNEFLLAYKLKHKSIRDFSSEQLHNLAVISGPNGCGKTQLLEAIENGAIEATDISGKKLTSKMFSSLPKLEARHVTFKELQAYQDFVIDAKELFDALESLLVRGLSVQIFLNNSWQTVNRITLQKALHEGSAGTAPRFKGNDQAEFENALIASAPNPSNRSRWESVQKFFPKQILASISEFNSENLKAVIYDLVQYQTFMEVDASAIFYRYFEESQNNAIKRISGVTCLTDDEFKGRYGNAPWNEVNALLQQYGFSHTFIPPDTSNDPRATKGYTAQLVNSVGEVISVESLSSGEKVIIALLLSAYASQQNTVNLFDIQAPDLLLFDELDAHLHPSMTRMMFDVLEKHVLDQITRRVILTTHSPSTVALTPSESNYRLLASETHALERVDPATACRDLSNGFIHIMDGSQIVIVEGKDDPLFYRAIERALRSSGRMNDIPTLHFIPASQTSNPSAGGGASAAADWATKLNDAKLPNIHALLDNDGHRTAAGAIKVLRGRYSIENFILDPFSLAVALIVDAKLANVDATLAQQFPQVVSIATASQVDLQKLVDRICKYIESKSSVLVTSNTMAVDYAFGKTINVPDWICSTRGKDLVVEVREAFKQLETGYIITKNDRGDFDLELGYLLKLWSQFPDLFPSDLQASLNALSS